MFSLSEESSLINCGYRHFSQSIHYFTGLPLGLGFKRKFVRFINNWGVFFLTALSKGLLETVHTPFLIQTHPQTDKKSQAYPHPPQKALHPPKLSYTQSIKKSHLPTLAYNQPKNVTLTRTYPQPVKNSHIHPHTSTPSTKKNWTHPHTSINSKKILLIHLHPLPAKICHIHPQ